MSALVVAAASPSIGPVLLLLTAGVLVTLAGHLTAARRLVALGIALVFAATLLMFVLGLGAYQRDG